MPPTGSTGTTSSTPHEREELLARVRAYQQAAAEQVEKLRVQLARAEDFEATLRARSDAAATP